MSEKKAITVVTERPSPVSPALVGGILGADLGLFAFIANYASAGSVLIGLLVTLLPSVAVAGITALVAYIIQQRRGSLSRLNRDLINLNSLMQRRLINEEDYQMLKERIINDYQPQRFESSSILKPALWAGLVTSLTILSLGGASIWAPVQIFFASMLLPGMGGAAAGVIGTGILHQFQWHRVRPELPAGEPTQWQALGTRQSLPEKK